MRCRGSSGQIAECLARADENARIRRTNSGFLIDEAGLPVPINKQPIAAATRKRARRETELKPCPASIDTRQRLHQNWPPRGPHGRAENKPLASFRRRCQTQTVGPDHKRVSASHYPIRALLKATPPSPTLRGLIRKTAGPTKTRGFFLRASPHILEGRRGERRRLELSARPCGQQVPEQRVARAVESPRRHDDRLSTDVPTSTRKLSDVPRGSIRQPQFTADRSLPNRSLADRSIGLLVADLRRHAAPISLVRKYAERVAGQGADASGEGALRGGRRGFS